MRIPRRKLLQSAAVGITSDLWHRPVLAAPASSRPAPLKITRLSVTPIALARHFDHRHASCMIHQQPAKRPGFEG